MSATASPALNVTTRAAAGKELAKRRSAGQIPAVLYGHGIDPRIFWVGAFEFGKVYATAGENSLVALRADEGKAVNVLIHDVQVDPLTNRYTHIDFFQVRMDEKLEAHVPLEFAGEAPAVRELGGVLVKPLEEVLVWCLPADLPHSIVVDLTRLKTFDDQLAVKDLLVPERVEILSEGETMVALVEPPRSEAEMAALNEKVEADVTKVEGVVKEAPVVEGEGAKEKEKEKEKEKKGE